MPPAEKTSQGADDWSTALDHRRRAAQAAVQLIHDALDGDQLARLQWLIRDAGDHLADALATLRTQPAT